LTRRTLPKSRNYEQYRGERRSIPARTKRRDRSILPNDGRVIPVASFAIIFCLPSCRFSHPVSRSLHKWTLRLNGRTGNCSDSSRPNKSHVSYFYFRPDARHVVIRWRQRRGSSGGFSSVETRLRSNEAEYARSCSCATSWNSPLWTFSHSYVPNLPIQSLNYDTEKRVTIGGNSEKFLN